MSVDGSAGIGKGGFLVVDLDRPEIMTLKHIVEFGLEGLSIVDLELSSGVSVLTKQILGEAHGFEVCQVVLSTGATIEVAEQKV